MGRASLILVCLLLFLLTYTAASAESFGWIKAHHADGDMVEVSGLITADFSGSALDQCGYIEDFDSQTMKPGCSGIKLCGFGGFEGMVYGLSATLATDSNGERYLDYVPGPVISVYIGATPAVTVNNRCVGGAALPGYAGSTSGQIGPDGCCGVNNIGLLIRTTGRVTHTDYPEQCFYIDDGSRRCDKSGHIGLRVSFADWPSVPRGSVPDPGAHVTVTGISALTTVNGKVCSIIRSRRMEDVQVTSGGR